MRADGDAEVLLFDLGRVLVDIDFARCFEHWGRTAGVDAQALARRFRVDERFEAHERGELACEDFFAGLSDDLGLGLDVGAVRAGWNAIFGPPEPALPPLLARAARRWPLHALSNTNAAHAEHWRRSHAAVIEPLGTVFTSHELGLRKPDPAIFRRVAEHLGVAPARIRLLDDAPANLDAAAAVGLRTTHVDSPARTAEWLRSALGEPAGVAGCAPRP